MAKRLRGYACLVRHCARGRMTFRTASGRHPTPSQSRGRVESRDEGPVEIVAQLQRRDRAHPGRLGDGRAMMRRLMRLVTWRLTGPLTYSQTCAAMQGY